MEALHLRGGPEKDSGLQEGDFIDDETVREGYIVDSRGRIKGETRRFDPYSRFGEVMLYDIDVFGFVCGYISKSWSVMSEKDLVSDRHLAKRLREAKYQVWKRHNVLELKEGYEKENPAYKDGFERFCREVFEKSNKTTI